MDNLAVLTGLVAKKADLIQTLLIGSLLVGVVGFLISTLWEFYVRHRKLVNVPIVNLQGWGFEAARRSYITDFSGIIEKGLAEYPNEAFQVWSPEGFQVMLPARYVPVFQNMDHAHADLAEAVEERFVGSYKWTKFTSQINNRACYQDLTPKYGVLIDANHDEMTQSFADSLGSTKEWHKVKLFDFFSVGVTRVTSRAFVGKEICRNKKWIEASIQYTTDAFVGSQKLKEWSLPMRPIVAMFLPETRRLRGFHALAKRLLVPVIRDRYRKQKDPSYKKPVDMIQWIMDQGAKEKSPPSPETQAELQMLIGLAGIQTSTYAAMHAILDLAARPEYIAPLREEAEQMFRDSDGRPQKKHLNALPLLDSFIKESQRFSPPDMITYDRVINTPITLDNGLHLPKGARIGVAALHISLSNESHPEAAEFQGFRFAHHEPGPDAKGPPKQHRFVSTSPSMMHFGHGKHACPGRFYAAAMLKLMFAKLLVEYDFKLVEGEERPKNPVFGSMILCKADASLMFRKR